MHDLLEIVVDNLGKRTLLYVVLDYGIELVEVVVAVVLADEVIEIHQELRSCYGTHELGRYRVDQIDELAAERLQVGRRNGYAAQLAETGHEEWVHRDGDAVWVTRSTALVMFVEGMLLYVLEVLGCQLPVIKGLDLVLHDEAVLLDVVLLIELLSEGYDILPRDIGVGVELRAGSGIRSLDIIVDEVPLLAEVHTRIEFLDILTRYFLVDGHEGIHHLTADLLA